MSMEAPKSEWTGQPIRLGVIGGSGLYKLEGIEIIDVPWGYPSSPISIAKTEAGTLVAFLARHGTRHAISPSNVPSTANIAALKHLGVRAILAFSAVGSLREEIRPKDFVVPSQIIDRTKGVRRSSYFGEGEEKNVVAHASFGDPYDNHLRPVVEDMYVCSTNSASIRETLAKHSPSVHIHAQKTVVCMEGPAFSTRAESLMYRQLGGDIINMSALPEAKLAREAELSYVLIATCTYIMRLMAATDYDAWRETADTVSVAEVMESLKANVEASQVVTKALVDRVNDLVKEDDSPIVKGLEGSMRFNVMTKPEHISTEEKDRLRYLLPWFPQ